MVRQARSEATRRKIITSAVELFNEIGYPATGLGDIIERAEMTKGALYYHFDSKESLATAIIEEASAHLVAAFRNITASSAPALENIIHGVFVVADLLSTDKIARSGTQLLRAFGEFNDAAALVYGGWVAEMTERTRQAIDEGGGIARECDYGRSRRLGARRSDVESAAAGDSDPGVVVLFR
jgi:AcrR family transcriptional regulator